MSSSEYRVILADPPWHFDVWKEGSRRNVTSKYKTMRVADIAALPVQLMAADDCVLFLWMVWGDEIRLEDDR